jgi:thiamine pyrophosphate-dependent acetolactate synthase large subunit-like protein
VETPDLSTATSIDPRVMSREIDSVLPADRIVAVDSGNFMGYPSQYLAVPDEFGFCFTQAFQAIGIGLYTAIGAAIARPDRLPVLGAGDGGFLMGISELETAVRLKLPLVCIVYNDAAYGAEVHHFAQHHRPEELASVSFPETDIAAIARGYGADGVTVRTLDDLKPVREWVAVFRDRGQDRPLVIDAKIASDGGSWWLAEAFQGH